MGRHMGLILIWYKNEHERGKIVYTISIYWLNPGLDCVVWKVLLDHGAYKKVQRLKIKVFWVKLELNSSGLFFHMIWYIGRTNRVDKAKEMFFTPVKVYDIFSNYFHSVKSVECMSNTNKNRQKHWLRRRQKTLSDFHLFFQISWW